VPLVLFYSLIRSILSYYYYLCFFLLFLFCVILTHPKHKIIDYYIAVIYFYLDLCYFVLFYSDSFCTLRCFLNQDRWARSRFRLDIVEISSFLRNLTLEVSLIICYQLKSFSCIVINSCEYRLNIFTHIYNSSLKVFEQLQ